MGRGVVGLLSRVWIAAVCCFLLGLTYPEAAGSQPLLVRSEASRDLLESARRHLLSYRMGEAEAELRRLQKRPDGRPAALYYLSTAALHRALMTDSDQQFDIFSERADSLKQLLRHEEASVWRDFMSAELDLYEAATATKRNHYVRAAWAARSAYGGFSKLADAFPEFYDVYVGLGMLHMAIGSMPSTHRFILKILGYRGSISGAFRELEDAYRRSAIGREEAGIYLALTHTMLTLDEEKSVEIMRGLHSQDPESILFSHLYGFVLLSNRQAKEAERVLLDAIRRAETGRYFYIDYMDFYVAEALFRQDRFAEAERYYRRYLSRHGGPALKALAHLGLGLTLEMQNRRGDALEHYELVRAARDFDTDSAARRAARRLVSEPMTAFERRLLMGRNAYDSGRYEAAEAILSRVLEDKQASASQRAEAAYRLGRVNHATKRYEEAVRWYQRGIELTEDRLDRWAPWGQFYIGKVRQEQGRPEEARAAYRKALDYEGKYDYFQALEQSARAALELLDG